MAGIKSYTTSQVENYKTSLLGGWSDDPIQVIASIDPTLKMEEKYTDGTLFVARVKKRK